MDEKIRQECEMNVKEKLKTTADAESVTSAVGILKFIEIFKQDNETAFLADFKSNYNGYGPYDSVLYTMTWIIKWIESGKEFELTIIDPNVLYTRGNMKCKSINVQLSTNNKRAWFTDILPVNLFEIVKQLQAKINKQCEIELLEQNKFLNWPEDIAELMKTQGMNPTYNYHFTVSDIASYVTYKINFQNLDFSILINPAIKNADDLHAESTHEYNITLLLKKYNLHSEITVEFQDQIFDSIVNEAKKLSNLSTSVSTTRVTSHLLKSIERRIDKIILT